MMKKSLFLFPVLALSLLAQGAERIVSATGNASEVVALLGKSEQLVGVDTTSLLPADVMADKPKIGYRRQLSAEGILALSPDLILLPPDAAPENAVAQLSNAGIAMIRLRDAQTLAGIRDDIATIGDAIGAVEEAKQLHARLLNDEARLADLKAQSGSGSALVLLNSGNRGVFALGKDSAGDHLLAILGLDNVADFAGNKPFAQEALATTAADVILIAVRDEADTAPVIRAIADNRHGDALLHSQAGQRGCVFAVNILAALGFGANTARDSGEILRNISPCLYK